METINEVQDEIIEEMCIRDRTYLYPFSLFHKNGGKTGETREARQLFLQTSHKLFHPFGSSFHQICLLYTSYIRQYIKQLSSTLSPHQQSKNLRSKMCIRDRNKLYVRVSIWTKPLKTFWNNGRS